MVLDELLFKHQLKVSRQPPPEALTGVLALPSVPSTSPVTLPAPGDAQLIWVPEGKWSRAGAEIKWGWGSRAVGECLEAL